jgi:hypothetical protein
MNVFLDLDPGAKNKPNISDKEIAASFLGKFGPILDSIGKRLRETKKLGVSYDSPSVALFDQARDLYFLGYFFSSIAICRSIAEYIAFEIFYEEVELDGSPELIKKVAESLDFRKILTDFLYNEKNDHNIIDKVSSDLFHQIYDTGNGWVHPHNIGKKGSKEIEEESKKMLEKTQYLIDKFRNVLEDNDIKNGTLVRKVNARKKIRPVVLGSGINKL